MAKALQALEALASPDGDTLAMHGGNVRPQGRPLHEQIRPVFPLVD